METRRDVFQAIADPTRRGILTQLLSRPKNLNALASHFDMTRQAVSLHVKILEECEVIKVKKEGRERYCQLQPEKLAEIAIWMGPFQKMWENRFQQLDNLLDPLNDQNDE